MLRSISVSAAALFLLANAASAQAPALSDADYLKLGNQYSTWLFAGNADSLAAHMADEARTKSGGAAGVADLRANLTARAGSEVWVVAEKMTRRGGNPQYWRESQFSAFADESLVLRWVMDARGQIIGIGLGPLSQTPAPDSATVK
ncbi:MAG: hypothetical protein H0U85_03065 [Gemmatimonadales bacterium]|nr:hypothetical protein [Gemmatimonadales bacterium]